MPSFNETLRELHGTSGIVEMLDITSPDGSIEWHITPYYLAAGFITYGGVDYTCFPYGSVGWELRATGTMPRPTLSVSNTVPEFQQQVIQAGDMNGYIARRYLTFEKNLDGAPEADPDAHSRYEIYYFNQKLQHNDKMISWQLASPIDQGNKVIPRRQYLKDRMPDGSDIPGSVYAPGLSRYIGL